MARSKALVNWQDELARDAKAVAAVEASVSVGDFISIRGGKFGFRGATLKESHLDVVVLEHVLMNTYYAAGFDPDAPEPPVCFAFGKDEKAMAPHEQSADKQHASCEGCPQNQFGTAEKGKGKACKNGRRLALVTASDLANLKDAQVAFLNIPPTSIKAWAGYVQNLAGALKRPPYAVVTRVSLSMQDNGRMSFPVLAFSLLEEIDMSARFDALRAKREAIGDALVVPFAAPAEKPAVAPRKRKY